MLGLPLIGSGNGIRRNPLLADLLGSAFELPLVYPLHTEEAAHGAAMLATVAAGELTLGEATARIGYEESSSA
jgi:ribulose kinase